MALDKNDLKEIKKIVQQTEARLGKQITGVDQKVDRSRMEVIATLSREITDLAEINRAVIERVDKISELEKRIIRIEHKIGITG